MQSSHLLNHISQHNHNNPSQSIPTPPQSCPPAQRLPFLLPGISMPSIRATSIDNTSTPKHITLSLSFTNPSNQAQACELLKQLNIPITSQPPPNTNNFFGSVIIPHHIDNQDITNHLNTHAPLIPIDIARSLQDLDIPCHQTVAAFRCPASMLEQLLSIPPWPSTPSHRVIEWSFIYRPFSTCTHCFMTGHGKQSCKHFQANIHNTSTYNTKATHACTICCLFKHHTTECVPAHKNDVFSKPTFD